MKQINLSITISISKKLDRLAELEHETRTTIIRSALRDYLDKKLLGLGDIIE